MSGYEWEFEQRDDGDPGLPIILGRTLDGRELTVRVYEDTRGCVAVSVETESEVTVALRLENGDRVIEETDYEFVAEEGLRVF
jgi:hypothetical protein